MNDPARLYFTHVMHRRLFPVEYRFVYKVFSLFVDLNRLNEVRTRLLSVNRFNLLSFLERDHGPRDGTPLRPWLDDLLSQRRIDLEGGAVWLLCFPRVLGFGFNPISIWYCYHRDGTLRAVLCEVNNTFGEHHFYLLEAGGRPMPWPVRQTAAKCFHVSPLVGMNASYDFSFFEPAQQLSVLIQEKSDDRLMLVASQSGEARPLDDRHLMLALLRTPLMTLKVVVAIHWQALKIWLRGAPFYPKPQPPHNEVT